MFSLLRRDAGKVFKEAKRKGLTHYEKEHRTRAMLYFKRAALACPARAGELAQFYYDNHDYKRACYFYKVRLSTGDATHRDYHYAARTYEKREAISRERRNWLQTNRCHAQAMAYRASIRKRFDVPPIPTDLTLREAPQALLEHPAAF